MNTAKMLAPYKESRIQRSSGKSAVNTGKTCSVSKAMGGAEKHTPNDQFTVEKHGLVYL